MSELPVKSSSYQAKLGECPVYDQRTNTLYWVDISARRILRKDLETNEESFVASPDLITSIQLAEKPDELVGTLRHEFCRINLETKEFALIGEAERDSNHNRFNDGKCDSLGRYWAGTMNLDLVSPTGSLYVLDLNKTITRKAEGLAISNGLAWSKDDKKMYLIDTPVKKVFQFDFDTNTGELENKEVCIDFKDETGRPDGMTIDSEGMLWVAHARGGHVSKWNPLDGRKISEFVFPVRAVTSLTFGGKRLDSLYVTTASELMNERDAGYVYMLRPGAKGSAQSFCRV